MRLLQYFWIAIEDLGDEVFDLLDVAVVGNADDQISSTGVLLRKVDDGAVGQCTVRDENHLIV